MVNHTLDCFMECSPDLHICAEVELPIHHAFLVNAKLNGEPEEIVSHRSGLEVAAFPRADGTVLYATVGVSDPAVRVSARVGDASASSVDVTSLIQWLAGLR